LKFFLRFNEKEVTIQAISLVIFEGMIGIQIRVKNRKRIQSTIDPIAERIR
jgi:hypothetical protein